MSSSRYFLTIEGLFEGGRLIVGGLSVVFLMSRGLSPSEIAYLKIIQSWVFILGELPTGILGDYLGRKKSLMLSCLCTIGGLVLYLKGSGLLHFFIAESLAALGICFWSGASEAFAIDSLKIEKKPGALQKYFHQLHSTSQFAVIAAGLLGSLLVSLSYKAAYIGSITVIATLFSLLFMCRDTQATKASIWNLHAWWKASCRHLQFLWTYGLSCKKARPLILMMVLLQFLIQPLLHYWQPFFLELKPDLTPQYLSTIFSSYCALSFFISYFVSKQKSFGVSNLIGLSILFFSIYLLVGLVPSFEVALIPFLLLQPLYGLMKSWIYASFNAIIPSTSRASLNSGFTLISRLGMLVSLSIISLKLKDPSFKISCLFTLFAISGLALILGSLILARIIKSNQTASSEESNWFQMKKV